MSATTLRPIVLIIDDDVEVRLAVMELLLDADYQPVTAKDGAEALQLLHAGLRPVTMLIDLSMPLMDGTMLCAECDLHPELAAIPRVIVSADHSAAASLARWRAHAFVSKPLVPERLLAAITSACRAVQR